MTELKISNRIFAFLMMLIMWLCFCAPAFAKAPEINSSSALLIDMNSEEILYQKGAHQEVLPSVSAKFMAIYTAINSQAEEGVTISGDWLDELTNDMPRMGISSGEKYTKKELITILYLADFYDIYICLANHVGSSQKGFVNMMNANAKKLGMVSTHYKTIYGYGDDEEYTTPYDVYTLIKNLSKDPLFKEIIKISSYTVKPRGHRKEPLEIRQKLNINDPQSQWYISGSRFAKMDFNKQKGYSIVFSILRDNREILWLSFGSENGDACATEAGEAGEYAFSDFKRVIYTKDEIKKLYKGEKNLYIDPTKDIYVTVPGDVEKSSLIATIQEENRIATFKAVGNGVDFETEVSKVKPSGLRFVWEWLLKIIKWLLVLIIALIVIICILYIPLSFVAQKKAIKAREKREEKVRNLKEKMKENE